jgi:hypothetical protein
MASAVIAGPCLEPQANSHAIAGEAKEKPILLEADAETLNASGVDLELQAKRVATGESDGVITSPFAPLDRTDSQRERNFDTMAVSITQVLGDHYEAKQPIQSVTAQYVANLVASVELLRTQVVQNSALAEERRLRQERRLAEHLKRIELLEQQLLRVRNEATTNQQMVTDLQCHNADLREKLDTVTNAVRQRETVIARPVARSEMLYMTADQLMDHAWRERVRADNPTGPGSERRRASNQILATQASSVQLERKEAPVLEHSSVQSERMEPSVTSNCGVQSERKEVSLEEVPPRKQQMQRQEPSQTVPPVSEPTTTTSNLRSYAAAASVPGVSIHPSSSGPASAVAAAIGERHESSDDRKSQPKQRLPLPSL